MAYDPLKVKVLIDGTPVGNLGKDVFLAFTYDNPEVTVRETLDGEGIHSIRRGNTGVMVLTCEHISDANTILSALYQKQRLTGGGQFVFQVVDTNVANGLSKFTSTAARVVQMPNMTFGAEDAPVEWEISCTNITHLMAGRPAFPIL